MKKKDYTIPLLFTLLFASGMNAGAQTPFWTETFNNGCLSGCSANGVNTGNGAWSIDNSGGCNDAFANVWYVSCAENGNAVGACGTGCGAAPTLHIGSTTLGDLGASYDAGYLSGPCPSGSGTWTNTRAVSPLISTVGKSGISVSFNYLMFGEAPMNDYGWVDYSTNGGATWTNLVYPAQTSCCGGPCNSFLQGMWGNYTSGVLPSAANNINNFRLRFGWINDDDASGNDPSFAISNLQVRYLVLLPVELLDFTAQYSEEENVVNIAWSTATETNNSYYTVERSPDGAGFSVLATVKGAGNSSVTRYYTAVDPSPYGGTSYYRLKQTDFDGNSVVYNPVAVTVTKTSVITVYPNPAGSFININYYAPSQGSASTLSIIDYTGRILTSQPLLSVNQGTNTCHINTSRLAAGIYILRLETAGGLTIFSRFAKQ